jgi:hypothetical protein
MKSCQDVAALLLGLAIRNGMPLDCNDMEDVVQLNSLLTLVQIMHLDKFGIKLFEVSLLYLTQHQCLQLVPVLPLRAVDFKFINFSRQDFEQYVKSRVRSDCEFTQWQNCAHNAKCSCRDNGLHNEAMLYRACFENDFQPYLMFVFNTPDHPMERFLRICSHLSRL